MASDVAMISPALAQQPTVAEGEAAPDLVAFAKALTAGGTRLFGADYADFVANQLSLFEDGARYLNYFEVVDGNRQPNAVAASEGITEVPTWKFSNGAPVLGTLTPTQLSTLTGVPIPRSSTPSFFPVESQTVKVGSPLHIPIDAYDPNGNPLTITVSSSDPAGVSAQVLTNNPSARFKIDGYGEMVFQLFQSEAPRPVNRFIALAQSGFYNTTATNSMTFHRVIKDFISQAGDPTGTGTGGSPLDNFDDQFNLNLQHNRSGVLSYAKSSNDTNDSQFFITDGEARFLDYNHSIFGQLIEGDNVRANIDRINTVTLPSGQQNVPAFDVVVRSVEIFNDTENGLVRLAATGPAGSTSNITVTVTDTEGNQVTQVFTVTVADDDANGTPFFGDISNGVQLSNRPITLQLTAIDQENDPGWYLALKANAATPVEIQFDSNAGRVTITPNEGFVGRAEFFVVVAKGPLTTEDLGTPSLYDSQLISVEFIAPFALSMSRPSIFEADGADQSATVTITRPTFGSNVPLEVFLSVSDFSRLNLPPSVTISANQTSTTFQVTAINSLQVEGFQKVTITGQASSFTATTTVDVYDDESKSPWHNTPSPFDVDRNGSVVPLDVLVVINQLVRSGNIWLPSSTQTISLYVDTDNDYYLSPVDILRVINAYRRAAVGEGEANVASADQSSALSIWLTDELARHRDRRSR